jgi:hypothetical protein
MLVCTKVLSAQATKRFFRSLSHAISANVAAAWATDRDPRESASIERLNIAKVRAVSIDRQDD